MTFAPKAIVLLNETTAAERLFRLTQRSQEDNEKEEENQDQGQDNPSNDDQSSDKEDNKDENNDQETQASLDADYSIDEFNLDEQLNEVEHIAFNKLPGR